AGPEMILVHSNVIDNFIKVLIKKLDSTKVDFNYTGDDVRVGPLFEKSSLPNFSKIVNDIIRSDGEIIYGGMVNYKYNLIYPCVCKHTLRKYANYEELYSPIFIISEYFNDDELDIYFNDANDQYIKGQMYVSVFGHSQYIAKKCFGTIPLVNVSIHDVEYGNEEYGGYGIEASSVSFKNIVIPKPLLIPREIYTYLLSPHHKIFQNIPRKYSNLEINIIENLFKENVSRIFSDNLIFAYIFGSYAMNRAKSYSDVDTLISVKKKDKNQIREYLNWLFEISEIFGKIPDFKYPAEIVEFKKLRDAVEHFSNLTLSSGSNSSEKYDAMVWLHSLSHYKIGILNEGNIPNNWESIFPTQSSRILKGFLADLRKKLLKGIKPNNSMYFNNFPTNKYDIENYAKNLGNGRKLINILKYISFEEEVLYNKYIIDIVSRRQFFGRKLLNSKIKKIIYNPMFRFGFVSDKYNE
ncbi:MAG: aldehyde dehydrogenase family protein, partial [bacterium]|nr:aldehyde dehydrogenase family protein [bacterium]